MVDDEEPLCLAVSRILAKYKVHVPDVGVDASYDFAYSRRVSSSCRLRRGR